MLSDGHIRTPVPEVPTQPVSTGKDWITRAGSPSPCCTYFSSLLPSIFLALPCINSATNILPPVATSAHKPHQPHVQGWWVPCWPQPTAGPIPWPGHGHTLRGGSLATWGGQFCSIPCSDIPQNMMKSSRKAANHFKCRSSSLCRTGLSLLLLCPHPHGTQPVPQGLPQHPSPGATSKYQ